MADVVGVGTDLPIGESNLANLRSLTGRMLGHVEQQLHLVGMCIERDDPDLSQQVITSDFQVDQLEERILLSTVSTLALRQPLGRNLREVVGILRSATDLERIGDLSKNTAKRLLTIGPMMDQLPRPAMVQLHHYVADQLQIVGDLMAVEDPETIQGVLRADDRIDELHNSVFGELMAVMKNDQALIAVGIQALFMTKNLERIGDHVTNIAENLYYIHAGDVLPTDRPKSDVTSFMLDEKEHTS